MAALTMDLAQVEEGFTDVAAGVLRTGSPVTVLKDGCPWVVIEPAETARAAVEGPLDVAVSFMGEYEDVFERLAR